MDEIVRLFIELKTRERSVARKPSGKFLAPIWTNFLKLASLPGRPESSLFL